MRPPARRSRAGKASAAAGVMLTGLLAAGCARGARGPAAAVGGVLRRVRHQCHPASRHRHLAAGRLPGPEQGPGQPGGRPGALRDDQQRARQGAPAGPHAGAERAAGQAGHRGPGAARPAAGGRPGGRPGRRPIARLRRPHLMADHGGSRILDDGQVDHPWRVPPCPPQQGRPPAVPDLHALRAGRRRAAGLERLPGDRPGRRGLGRLRAAAAGGRARDGAGEPLAARALPRGHHGPGHHGPPPRPRPPRPRPPRPRPLKPFPRARQRERGPYLARARQPARQAPTRRPPGTRPP